MKRLLFLVRVLFKNIGKGAMSFHDARLHLTLRCDLESDVPKVGEAFHRGLLGLDNFSHTQEEWKVFSSTRSPPSRPAIEDLPPHVVAQVNRVRRLMKQQCSLNMRKWGTHLKTLHRNLSRLVSDVRDNLEHHDTQQLSQHLESRLRSLKETPLPDCSREARLIKECGRLRQMFHDEYGQTSTRLLLQAKPLIEATIQSADSDEFESFVRTLKTLLE